MPKGVYDRSKTKDPAAVAEKPARKARKARAIVSATTAKGAPPAPFGVALDLRAGAVTITAASGTLALAPDELAALLNLFRGR